MKIITLLSIPFIMFAAGETMKPSEHMSIHNANQRPAVQTQKKQKMHKLHKIDEERAVQIVKEQTQEDAITLILTHSGKYLIYKARTAHYRLTINALDGSVMKKEIVKELTEQ